MDATELARWTRFAAKGGIGKCTALSDCIAENDGDLMFLKSDEIVVLMKLNEHEGKFLGYCEGVVGKFSGTDVRFHGKLKKPVITKRSSVSTTNSVRSSSSRQSSSVQSPVLRPRLSTDGEKPSSPPLNIDPAIHRSHSKRSLPTSQSTSISTSPVDHAFSIAGAMSVYDNEIPPSPQVTAPLRIPNKITPSPTSPSHFAVEFPPEPTNSEVLSYDSEPPTATEQSYVTYEDPTTRYSVASSDAEVGIGLTMLQALAGDNDDDDDNWSHSSRYSTRLSQGHNVPHVPDQSGTQEPPSNEPVIPKDFQIPQPSPSPSTQSFPDSEARRPSLAPSASSSSSWENAIYDDYRYTRYSLAGKLPRFSTVGGTVAGDEQPPPIPDSRPSLDSRPSVESKRSLEAVRPPPRLASLDFHKFRFPSKPPIPLVLQPRNQLPPENVVLDQRSPLLHTTWASPTSSKHESAASCYSSDADTAFLHREDDDDDERPTSQASSKVAGEGPGSQIVVEDDEELPTHVISSTLHESPFSSPEPTLGTADVESIDTDDSIAKPTDVPEPDTRGSEPTPTSASSVPSPPPLPATDKFPDQLRPSLADLRGELIPGTNQRQSLFLPHPNAPKSPGFNNFGPLYIQSPQARSTTTQPGPPRMNSVGVIHMALSRPLQPPTAWQPFRGPTIYGRVEADFSVSPGPVPISFSIDPFPAKMPISHSPPLWRPATAPIPDPSTPIVPPPVPKQPQHLVERSATVHHPPSTSSNVIPRPGFSPRAPGARPRSRSFSGFDSSAAATEDSLSRLKRQPDSGATSNLPSMLDVKRSFSSSNVAASTSVPSSPTPSSSAPAPFASASVKAIAKSSPLRPSPLSLPQNSLGSLVNDDRAKAGVGSPTINNASIPSVLQPGSSLPAITTTTIASKLSISDSPRTRPESPSSQSHSGPLSPVEPGVEKQSIRPSIDTDTTSINSDSRSFFAVGPPSAGGPNSIRTKLSLPNLRKARSKQDETSSLNSQTTENVDTVQVKDTDFELVRPNLPFISTSRTSEDWIKDGSLEPPSGLISPGSPALSTYSFRSAAGMSDSPSRNSPRTEPPLSPLKFMQENDPSIDAHRQRELRWVSVMAAVLPAQSRKTKKIKKLLLEGVPASVRYLVWSHVTNGREKIVAGVYAQLCSRGRVAASEKIESDIFQSFREHPELQGRESPVLTVLQAYLNMVPDIWYDIGLTRIAGQLLLQGPEEEVFWIFVSLMDTYLRPYFSANNTQLEVDATLFSRALENNDPQLAKRILMDMSIPPEVVCADWFKSVFANSLPTDYVNRVWDIFMYEGVPFLFRVGLAILNCCRVLVLQATSEKMALDIIRHPPVRVLPPSPDAFVTLALDQKLKDDDVRKQRIKMEAQVKRQTQAQTPRKSTTIGTISLLRT